MSMAGNRLRDKLDRQETALGAAVQLNAPWLVDMCGIAGFDYVLLDGEHGAAGYGMPDLIIAAQAAGITPVTRIPEHGRGWILPALEAGTGGIMAPMVDAPEQARRLVEEVKYAPLGRRGFSLATRASRYGTALREEHLARANRETLLIVTLETAEALRHAEEISRVPGIDLLFVGRDDLTESLGAADRNAPRVQEAVRGVIAAAGGRVPVGTTAFTADEARLWSGLGVRLLLTGTTGPICRTLQRVRSELADGL